MLIYQLLHTYSQQTLVQTLLPTTATTTTKVEQRSSARCGSVVNQRSGDNNVGSTSAEKKKEFQAKSRQESSREVVARSRKMRLSPPGTGLHARLLYGWLVTPPPGALSRPLPLRKTNEAARGSIAARRRDNYNGGGRLFRLFALGVCGPACRCLPRFCLPPPGPLLRLCAAVTNERGRSLACPRARSRRA